MSNSEYILENAVEMAKESPYTFYLPSDEVIHMLNVDDNVKLTFMYPSGNTERMWVLIKKMDGERFEGELDNDPVYSKSLKAGDIVHFEKKHINNTLLNDPVPSITEKYTKRCFVTNNILYGSDKVGYIYREKPDQDDDSGWRMNTGKETDEYMNDADNVFCVSLGAVLRKDDSVVNLLDSPTGASFRRDIESNQFIKLS
jgi:hypothetical protein